jgi:hypothetical protein
VETWQTLPDGAWSGGPRPGAAVTGVLPPSTPMPLPPGQPGGMSPNGMSAGRADGLIDAPTWLSNASGPTPGSVLSGGVPFTAVPVTAVPVGPRPAGPPAPLAATPAAPQAEPPYQPPPPQAEAPYQLPAPQAEQPYQPPAAQAEPGPDMSGSKRGELTEVVVTTPPDRIGPVVPALLCPSGHVNPPSGGFCRRCGAPLPHDPVPVPRPVLGVLRLSLGDVITLDRGVLMGRNPRTDFAGPEGFGGVGGEERPHVVRLPSADGDISRTHLRVTLDGWHVLVTDLNSTNGTLVTLPGRETQQLRPGEPVPIQPGTVVALADGIDFRYEVTD